jgi:hypothetical protein
MILDKNKSSRTFPTSTTIQLIPAITVLAIETREREPHRAVGVGGHRASRGGGASGRGRILRRSRRQRRAVRPSARSCAAAPCTRRNPRSGRPPRLRAPAIADRPRRALLPSSIPFGRPSAAGKRLITRRVRAAAAGGAGVADVML